MIGALFQEYVRWYDKQMDTRKVLLLVDNCSTYLKIEGLKNVKFFFFATQHDDIKNLTWHKDHTSF